MPYLDRANSIPDLRNNRYREQVTNKYETNDSIDRRNIIEEDEEFFVIGDRVYVDGYRAGSVAYFGETHFGAGDWVGVVLDRSTGNHDGKLNGREYFQCAPNHGLFVRPHRVSRISDSAIGSSATSSRCQTPVNIHSNRSRLDQNNQQKRSVSRTSTGSSLLDSYYYDDDYRQDKAPTVASLTQKLRSINSSKQGYLINDHEKVKETKSTMPTKGILKHDNRSNSRLSQYNDEHSFDDLQSSAKVRFDELNRRLRASSASPSAPNNTVFNFRPKREQLIDQGSTNTNLRRSVRLSRVEPPEKGDRVLVRTDREDSHLVGILRFIGETNFATGEWAGIELDNRVGKNDGSILGVRYFKCPDGYGLFVPATRVSKYDSHIRSDVQQPKYSSNPSIFNSVRSTIKSPPPRSTSLSRFSSSRSTTPSYDLETLSPHSQSSSMSTTSKLHLDDSCLSPSSPSLVRPFERYLEPIEARTSSIRQYPTNTKQYLDYDNRDWSSSRSPPTSSITNTKDFQKFDDHDIDLQLRKSLNRSSLSTKTSSIDPYNQYSNEPKPKAVEYTFISNRSNGNPIARKTLIYK